MQPAQSFTDQCPGGAGTTVPSGSEQVAGPSTTQPHVNTGGASGSTAFMRAFLRARGDNVNIRPYPDVESG